MARNVLDTAFFLDTMTNRRDFEQPLSTNTSNDSRGGDAEEKDTHSHSSLVPIEACYFGDTPMPGWEDYPCVPKPLEDPTNASSRTISWRRVAEMGKEDVRTNSFSYKNNNESLRIW